MTGSTIEAPSPKRNGGTPIREDTTEEVLRTSHKTQSGEAVTNVNNRNTMPIKLSEDPKYASMEETPKPIKEATNVRIARCRGVREEDLPPRKRGQFSPTPPPPGPYRSSRHVPRMTVAQDTLTFGSTNLHRLHHQHQSFLQKPGGPSTHKQNTPPQPVVPRGNPGPPN